MVLTILRVRSRRSYSTSPSRSVISSESRFCHRVFCRRRSSARRCARCSSAAWPSPASWAAASTRSRSDSTSSAAAARTPTAASSARDCSVRARGLLGDPASSSSGKARTRVELGVPGLRGGLAHDGRNRQDGRVDPRLGEHPAVAFGDRAPPGASVDLGERQHDVRAPGADVPGQREFGGAQRRGRVGDEDHGVRFGEQVERGGGARRPRVADRRGVHQDEPGRQEFARHADLDAAERAGGPGAELAGEPFDRDGDPFAGPADQGGGGFGGVADFGGDCGGRGVADRAHGRVQHGVEQVSLALFGKAEHAEPGLPVGGVHGVCAGARRDRRGRACGTRPASR